MYKNTNEDEESVKSASTLDTDKTEKAGTLVTKYFFSVLLCNNGMAVEAEFYTECSSCPHVSSKIRQFMYKPLFNESL